MGVVDLLSEHVYCVAITFKMTEQIEQEVCIKFYIKLEHSSVETIQIIQKSSAVGNWWLAASSQQCARTCIMSHAECFSKTSNHPDDSAPPESQIWGPVTSAFFQNWNHLQAEREEISGCHEIQENMTGQQMAIPTKDCAECLEQWMRCWENCVRSQNANFEGDWSIICLCTMFLISCSFFNKCLYFS